MLPAALVRAREESGRATRAVPRWSESCREATHCTPPRLSLGREVRGRTANPPELSVSAFTGFGATFPTLPSLFSARPQTYQQVAGTVVWTGIGVLGSDMVLSESFGDVRLFSVEACVWSRRGTGDSLHDFQILPVPRDKKPDT